METAKVDIRKLQVLNDRINQCIDALNQVRLSVHGLSHTSPQGFPFVSPGINPLAQSPLGYAGVGPMGFAPYLPGVSHSAPVVANPAFLPGLAPGISPFSGLAPGISPFSGLTPGFSPFTGLSHASPAFLPGLVPGINPGLVPGISPFAGLSHTSEEAYARPTWADPLLAFRIAQTFPYAQYPFPAVVTIW